VIALIFFGPRKLPQLARSVGKGLAEFRKASDDFKRTWEREVAAEEMKSETENTILPAEELAPEPPALLEDKPTPEPIVASADPELVVARGSVPEPISQTEALMPEPLVAAAPPDSAPEPLCKQEWL
jgi:TatA/E family protein of Tat protein translocase